MSLKNLIAKRFTSGNSLEDYHVFRFFSAFIAVSNGKIIDIEGPFLEYCPLVNMLYGDIKYSENIKEVVGELVTKKISEFGFFTSNRKFNITKIAVPFGASEMLMYALRKKAIDAAVVVCDGTGSIITTDSEVVQEIGGRMNGLFFTSPIPKIIEALENKKCRVVFSDARINQIEAVEKACELGYKNIAVTINGYVEDEKLSQIKSLEDKYSANITLLIVCTTGASFDRIQEIAKYADVVWSCASEGIRKVVGRKSILQISKKIPVFVLTQKGLNLIAAYSENEQVLKDLDKNNQYLLSKTVNNKKVMMGEKFLYYLSESILPVRSKDEPKFSESNNNIEFKPIGPCGEYNCSVCVFTKSQAPGNPYDLKDCPRYDPKKRSSETPRAKGQGS